MQELLPKITAIQATRGLNNSQFAKLMNISPAMWGAIVRGKRLIGDKTLNRIIVSFPELSPEILAYIRRKNGKNGDH